jgi:antitoxin component YwqK of YwqJK toxin-antitoxin module
MPKNPVWTWSDWETSWLGYRRDTLAYYDVNRDCLEMGIRLYSNGKLAYKGKFHNNGLRAGFRVDYAANGQIRYIGECECGKKDGWGRQLNFSGKKVSYGLFIDNQPVKHLIRSLKDGSVPKRYLK